jgi:hypothetical protein
VAALLVLLSSPPPQPTIGTATAAPIANSAAKRRFERIRTSTAFVVGRARRFRACLSSYAREPIPD